MQEILIPTDFSRASKNAVDYALSLFEGSGNVFHFLNTYTPDFVHSRVMALTQGGGATEDPMQLASEEGLKSLVGEISERCPNSGHVFYTTSSFNLLTEEIKEQLSLKEIDLIISGTTGASGLKEVFLGSNTVRILRASSDCPVLVVPQETRFKKPVKIGLVTDFANPYTAGQIATMLFFANKLQAKIQVMHIGNRDGLSGFQELHKHQLFMELERLDPQMQWSWPQASKASVIQEYIREHSVDLLIMIRNDHRLVEEWVREPVVKKVAFHTRVPMLVLPPVKT